MESQRENNTPDDSTPDDSEVAENEVAEREREWTRTPRCRYELGASLDDSDDSIDPPPKLASRTCTKIWKTIDNEVKEQDYTPNSGTFLDSAFFSPETVLPSAYYLLGDSELDEIKSEKQKPARKVEVVKAPPRRTPWIGLIASISVGMVIAGFLFPTIIYVTRSTHSYVAGNWEREINNRVGTYEQIHGQAHALQSEELLPYNLAASSWQELHFVSSNEGEWHFPPRSFPTLFEAVTAPAYGNPYADQTSGEMMWKEQSSVLHLDGFIDWEIQIPSDMSGIADTMLLVTPGQETSVRSAFGQNILLRDGRVFFRVLPGVE